MRRWLFALILLLLGGISVHAQQFLYFPIILKGNSMIQNDWRLIDRVGNSNYCLNPSAETTGNFAAESGTTVTRSTTYQKYGLYSYRVQSNANDEGIRLTLSSLTNANHFVTVRMRGVVPDWDWSLDNSTYRTPKLIEKIDQDWNLYGAHFPAGEANSSTTLRIHQKGVGTGDFYIDGIQVEPLSSTVTSWTTYIDGTQKGCEWLGVEHAAISQRSSESKAGGESQDFYEEYGFFIEKVVGAGSSPLEVNTQSYATLPGGEFSSEKIEVRDFSLVGRFVAVSAEDLHNKRQALRSALLQRGGQGTPIRYNGAEVQKEITAYYTGGLEGDLAAFYGDFLVEDEAWQRNVHYTERVAIQLRAPNPYWFEVGESAATLDTNDSATFRTIAARLRSTGQWDDLGPPDASGTYTSIRVIVEDDTYVYIGGNFTNFDNIASADYIVRYHKQNGTFSALGGGLNSTVYALELAHNGDLYIGGDFTNAGGVAAADFLTRWDGSSYNAVGTPNTGAASITRVSSLAVDENGILYVGGIFSNWADIANADGIASWDGSSYSALSTGVTGGVLPEALALAVDNANILYVGGNFTSPDNNIVSWDGSSFSSLISGGSDSSVQSLVVGTDNLVYIGGSYSTIGGLSISKISAWNGTTFLEMSSGVTGNAVSLDIDPPGNIWIGGVTTSFDGILRWNGSVFATTDIDLPAATVVQALMIGENDPVLKNKFDVFVGFDVENTANFAGLVTVANDGTVPVYPVAKFNRSGGTSATIRTLRNETTARELFFDEYNLRDGETLVIDLQPTEKSVISLPFEQRKPGAILANSDFGQWALLPGDNDVTSFIDVAGGPTITASLLWRDAYESYD